MLAATTQPAIDQLAGAGDWGQLGKETLAKVLQWMEAAGEFVAEQAPLLVQEVLRWGKAKAIIGIIAFALLSAILFVVGTYFIRWANKHDTDNDEAASGVLGIVCWVIGLIALIFGFGQHVMNLVYICVAPRLYLLETLRDLMKGQQ